MSDLIGKVTLDGLYIVEAEIKSPQEALTAMSMGLEIFLQNRVVHYDEPIDVVRLIPPAFYVLGYVYGVASPKVFTIDKMNRFGKQECLDVLLDSYSKFKEEPGLRFVRSCIDVINEQ